MSTFIGEYLLLLQLVDRVSVVQSFMPTPVFLGPSRKNFRFHDDESQLEDGDEGSWAFGVLTP